MCRAFKSLGLQLDVRWFKRFASLGYWLMPLLASRCAQLAYLPSSPLLPAVGLFHCRKYQLFSVLHSCQTPVYTEWFRDACGLRLH